MLKFILPILAVSALSAQVSMPVSPVLGSPTLLIVNWDSAQTTGPLVLIMHTNPGQVQGACYLSLTRDGAAVTAALYRTTTSTPEEPVGGLVGGAPWYYPTISSNACGIYLNDSVVNGNEIRLRIENGVTPYNKQVVANYETPCPPGAPWWQCGWGANFVSTTIGSWDATPAQPDTTPPTISAVDPVPAATSASGVAPVVAIITASTMQIPASMAGTA